MVHACTIIARNYLPAARVLARSFLDHHPGGSFATLVIDDVYGLVDPAAEPFEVLRLADLDLPEAEQLEMAAIYDVMELATAVKPWLLELLLDRYAPAGSVLYLDPDIKIFAPLDDLDRLAGEHGIVLTPHATAPMPRDGKGTDETAILASGAYNLGFVALGPGGDGPAARELLEFWKQRLRRECFVDPKRMRFVDQRWVDFAPGMFETAIVRDPAYNVAYWNLDHRPLSFDGRYLIDGRPLRFFHFSGYTPKVPHLLSKHQGPKPRILLSGNPALRRICDEYGADLLAAGYEQAGADRYAFAATSEGLELDQFMRRVYREALEAAEEDGEERPPNPLDPKDGGRFLTWLNGVDGPARTESGSKMSRYLAAVYDRRPDLRAAFPEALADARRMYEWARHEAAVGRLDPRLAPDDPPASGAGATGAPPPGELKPGIRVAGYLRAETGVGEHGRLAIEASRAAVTEVSVHVDTHTLARQHHPFFGPERDDLNVNLVCVNADELPRFAARVGEGFFAGRYNIGLWAWELERFPEKFHESFAYVDEVWANSEFTRAAIEQVASKPVHAFPLPVVEPHVPASLSDPAVVRARHSIPADRFCFYFAFDLFSIPARKNPFGLIEAFSRAFTPGEGPVLVIKAVGGSGRTEDLERLKYVASQRPDVLVLDCYLDRGESAALMAASDCYTSLHRAEGFGLTMAEAMALGKPVIATAYSGNLDFMTEETSYLVPVTMGEVPPGSDPYPAGTPWAEPDLDVAAQLMRSVLEDPAEAAERGRLAREHVLEHHGIEARAAFVAERFGDAQSVLAARLAPPPAEPGAAVEVVEPPLIAMARRTPDVASPSRYPRLARLTRQAVLRALRHRDELQHELDLAMAMGIEHVARIASLNRIELDRVEGELQRLREHARILEERLAVGEEVAASRDVRTRVLLERVGDRLSGLGRAHEELNEAVSLLEKDVEEQGGELDRMGAAWRAPADGPA